MKRFNGKITFIFQDQLMDTSLISDQGNGFLVFETINNSVLLDFVQNHSLSHWFFNSDNSLWKHLETGSLSIDSNKYLWTTLNAYSEMQLFRLIRLLGDFDETQQILSTLWNLKEVIKIPLILDKLSLHNATISVTAMTVS